MKLKRLSREVWVIAFAYLLAHLLTSTRYGVFRDAMYLLDCSKHLAWGYVDQPPLFPFIAFIARHLTGESLPGLIFWPALAGALRIVFTAALAGELGAGRLGTAFAALLGATTGVGLIIDHQFSMNAFEPLFWTACAECLVLIVKKGDPRLWIPFGFAAGLGLENKYSMAVFGAALLLGLLSTPERRVMVTPWFIAGGLTAFAVEFPNLLWEVRNQWPFLQFLHNVGASGKDIVVSPVEFIFQQILIVGPGLFPFWFGGLLYLLFGRSMKPFRFLGWAFVFTIAAFIVLHGKNYYPFPAYPLVFAAGGLAFERLSMLPFIARKPLGRRALVATALLLVFLPLAVFLPVALPVLPIDEFLAYQRRLPIAIPRSETGHLGAELPQYYADEFGWPEMVAQVARVYAALPPGERKSAAIGTGNYGEAGAIDYFGPRYGLPPAISTHNNYWFWGTHGYGGGPMILVGNSRQRAQSLFTDVQVAATLDNPYALPYENRPILLCRHPKRNLTEIWPESKEWR